MFETLASRELLPYLKARELVLLDSDSIVISDDVSIQTIVEDVLEPFRV